MTHHFSCNQTDKSESDEHGDIEIVEIQPTADEHMETESVCFLFLHYKKTQFFTLLHSKLYIQIDFISCLFCKLSFGMNGSKTQVILYIFILHEFVHTHLIPTFWSTIQLH